MNFMNWDYTHLSHTARESSGNMGCTAHFKIKGCAETYGIDVRDNSWGGLYMSQLTKSDDTRSHVKLLLFVYFAFICTHVVPALQVGIPNEQQ